MPSIKVDHERVRQLLAAGNTQTQVARRLGVSKTAVCYVAKGMRQEAAK